MPRRGPYTWPNRRPPRGGRRNSPAPSTDKAERRKALRAELGRVLVAIQHKRMPTMRDLELRDALAWAVLIAALTLVGAFVHR